MEYDQKQATEYLETGGLGEVIGLTDMARQMERPKVQMNTDMAMALCLLADEALKVRVNGDADMMEPGLYSSLQSSKT